MGVPQGSGGLIMEFPSPSTKQWNYLTHRHSWELGLQTPEHIHTPVGHACHASRGLVSSETLWFCLEPQSIQLPSTTSRRFPYLGHIGLTIWEAIIGEEGLRTRFPFSQQAVSQWRMWQAHTHCTHQYSYFGRLGLVNLRQITEQYAYPISVLLSLFLVRLKTYLYPSSYMYVYMDYLYDSRVQNHDFSSRVNCENVLFTKKLCFLLKMFIFYHIKVIWNSNIKEFVD